MKDKDAKSKCQPGKDDLPYRLRYSNQNECYDRFTSPFLKRVTALLIV